MKALRLCSLSTAALISAGLLLFPPSLPSQEKQTKPSPVAKKRSKKKPGLGKLPFLAPEDSNGGESQQFGQAQNAKSQIANLQKNLAAKDQEIADLQTMVAKQQSRIAYLADALNTTPSTAETKPKKSTSVKNDRIAIPKKKDPPPAIAPVYYKKHWAVNYEERDRVLEHVKELLEENPKTKVVLVGHADDSMYDQANQDISLNRARNLAAYLTVNGADKNRLTFRGVGNTQKPKIGPNRRVDIYIK